MENQSTDPGGSGWISEPVIRGVPHWPTRDQVLNLWLQTLSCSPKLRDQQPDQFQIAIEDDGVLWVRLLVADLDAPVSKLANEFVGLFFLAKIADVSAGAVFADEVAIRHLGPVFPPMFLVHATDLNGGFSGGPPFYRFPLPVFLAEFLNPESGDEAGDQS